MSNLNVMQVLLQSSVFRNTKINHVDLLLKKLFNADNNNVLLSVLKSNFI